MPRGLAHQEAAAKEPGNTLHEWPGCEHRYRLRRLASGRAVVERQYAATSEWRRMTYADDLVSEMARLAELAAAEPAPVET